MEISRFNNEQVRITMTFDNGETYIASTENTGDKVLETCTISENEGNTNGNPLGIMSSNTINFTIYDSSGILVKTNKISPYYGYMRNGVKCILEWKDNNGTWHPFGTYYTNSWNNTRSDGGYQSVSIGAKDRLNYIGNLTIPELPAFSSIEIKTLLVEIFKAIGLSDSDYYIDQSLNLTLTFSITKGAQLRETLNAIAQALIARITINRQGVIEIKPAFPEIPTELDIIDGKFISTGAMEQNQYTDYASVQLSYYELGIQNSVTLATLNNANVTNGLNSFDNLQLSNRVQGIDLVTFEYDVTSENNETAISDINYIGYQGGVSVNIKSESTEQIVGTITIEGRETGNSEVVISRDIIGADKKVSNTLMLTSDYIQNKNDAQSYINAVVDYINKIRNSGRFEQSIIGFMLETGKYISLQSEDDDMDGTYYIQGITFNIGETFSCSFEATKFDS